MLLLLFLSTNYICEFSPLADVTSAVHWAHGAITVDCYNAKHESIIMPTNLSTYFIFCCSTYWSSDGRRMSKAIRICLTFIMTTNKNAFV